MSTSRLSPEEVARFHRDGYLAGIPVIPPAECPALLHLFQRLRALLPPGTSTQRMDWWHGEDRELWQLCTRPAILDAVEAVLGADFFLWGTQFFAKDPGDGKTTPWHQDAHYWPLAPHQAVTAWLAFTDCDRENGCMEVIPGSHRTAPMRYRRSNRENDVLEFELEDGERLSASAVPLCLRAGEMSLHDDRLIHGSGANRSSRLRCGLTLRYSAGLVRCDLAAWPFFRAYWVRGTDRWEHNPAGIPPTRLMERYRAVTPEPRSSSTETAVAETA
jgi:non-heme Fe2+,alpha-ketoglutarate-dependent halogenase